MSSSNSTSKKTLEIEQRFIASPECVERILCSNGRAQTDLLRDVYYDNPREGYPLMLSDRWLRRRSVNGNSQGHCLKVSATGEPQRSGGMTAYHEITDDEEIARELGVGLHEFSLSRVLTFCGYVPVIVFNTKRHTVRSGNFIITVDEAHAQEDFVHGIVEIEIRDPSALNGSSAQKHIAGMARTFGLDPQQQVAGKVPAYLSRFIPELYREMVERGALGENLVFA